MLGPPSAGHLRAGPTIEGAPRGREHHPDTLPPTVFVLFGATGDLARRMVLPAFYELAQRGLLPEEWRLVGNGRGDVSHEDFGDRVHDALDRVRPVARTTARGRSSASGCASPAAASTPTTPAACSTCSPRRGRSSGRRPAGALPRRPAHRLRRAHQGPGRARPGQGRARRLREALRHLAGHLPRARRAGALGPRRGAGLPDRPLPRQGGHPGPARAALRQPALPTTSGAASTSRRCRSTSPRSSTSPTAPSSTTPPAPPRHARHPPVPGRRRGGDGAAGQPGRRRPAGGPRGRASPPSDRSTRRRTSSWASSTGYRDIDGIADDSTTDTFVAARLWVDTDRWRGVPFLLRTGKRLARQRAAGQPAAAHARRPAAAPARRTATSLSLSLSGSGSLDIGLVAKEPGPELDAGPGDATMPTSSVPGGATRCRPTSRSSTTCCTGDRSLFTTSDGLAKAWEAVAPLLDSPPEVQPYEPGSWGPAAAAELAGPEGWLLGDGES